MEGLRNRFTIRELLSLHSVATGSPEILAGQRYLDRAVRWVHISEQLDIAEYLQGGELLLTSGLRLKDAPTAQIANYVVSLRSRGVAGVVVRVSGEWGLPSSFLSAATDHQLPVILLRNRVPFSVITEEAHDAILGKEVSQLRWRRGFRRHFGAMMLQEKGFPAIVQELSRVTRSSVILESSERQILAIQHLYDTPFDLSVRLERLRAAAATAVSWPGDVMKIGSSVVANLRSRSRLWGRLYLIAESEDDQKRMAAVEGAVSAIRLSTITDLQLESQIEKCLLSLISGLLSGNAVGDDDELRQMHLYGERQQVADYAGIEVAFDFNGSHVFDLTASFSRDLLATLRKHATSAGLQLLITWNAGRLIGIAPAQNSRFMKTTMLDVLIATLKERGLFGEVVFLLGISDIHPVENLRLIPGELAVVFEYLGASGSGENSAASYNEVGFVDLIRKQLPPSEIEQYVSSCIGSLLGADSAARTLFCTLKTYLQENGQAGPTAERLYIERRTLYHRLNQIESRIGRKLKSARTQLELGLALEIFESQLIK